MFLTNSLWTYQMQNNKSYLLIVKVNYFRYLLERAHGGVVVICHLHSRQSINEKVCFRSVNEVKLSLQKKYLSECQHSH